MTKRKKPTLREVQTAIDGILKYMMEMQKSIGSLDSALGSYIEYKGDNEKWTKWLQEKLKETKEENDARQSDPEQSEERNSEA